MSSIDNQKSPGLERFDKCFYEPGREIIFYTQRNFSFTVMAQNPIDDYVNLTIVDQERYFDSETTDFVDGFALPNGQDLGIRNPTYTLR